MPDHAVRHYERSVVLSDQMRETGFRPEIERDFAEALLQLGDLPGAAAHAEAGMRVVAADDWASIANTKMALGLVRANQEQKKEAEALLREAVAVIEGLDYVADRWEQYLAMSTFLLTEGRDEEAREWIGKTRETAALFGDRSPILAYVERRLAAATPARR